MKISLLKYLCYDKHLKNNNKADTMIRSKYMLQKAEIILLFFLTLREGYHDPTENSKNFLTDFGADRTSLVRKM